jgi:hypothetical protein
MADFWWTGSAAAQLLLGAVDPPLSAGAMVVAPSIVHLGSRRDFERHAAWMQSVFRPSFIPNAPNPAASAAVLVHRAMPVPSEWWRNNYRALFAGRIHTPMPTTPPIPRRGGAPVAILRMDPEDGSSITYSWATDIMRPKSGREKRLSLRTVPRETYSFNALLDDDDLITIQSALVRNAAQGALFGIGLGHESLECNGAVLTAKTIGVNTTAYSDWIYPGSPALLVSADGDYTSYLAAVVQSSTATSITFDVDVSAYRGVGCRVMPLIPSYMNDQSFGLYAVNAGVYELKAQASMWGYASGLWTINGATVNTWTSPLSTLTWPVFDKRIEISGDTTPRALLPMSRMLDRGGALQQVAMQAVSDHEREILVTLRNDPDRQYLKKFLGTVLGQEKAFLCPTWKPDIIPIGDASGGTLVFEGPTSGRINYGEWFASDAHKVIRLEYTNGTFEYAAVSDWADNHNGTQTIVLDAGHVGTLAMVSLMETCRLATDDVVVAYQTGGVGTCRIPVHVVQQLT